MATLFVEVYLFVTNNTYQYHEVYVVFGALFPDVVDKALYRTKQCHATRSYGHSILFCVICSTLCWVISQNSVLSCIVALSLLSHLFADLFFGYVPLFYPFQQFRYPSMVHTHSSLRQLKILELLSFCCLLLFTSTVQSIVHWCGSVLARYPIRWN